jgi:hypothetical protein
LGQERVGVASSCAGAPRLGPSRAFCHVRLVDGAPVVEGSPAWRGGTVVGGDGDGAPTGTANAEGVFGGWEVDSGTVRVTVDPLGFFPLYYFATSTEFCVAPSILTLLERGAPRTFDDDALAVFLRIGYFIADDTPFAAVRVVPPSHRFEWSGGTLRIERAERPHHEVAIDRARAIDTYVELFRAAVARRLVPGDEPFTLPLSGGCDSRHILLELIRQGRPPSRTVTGTQRPWCPDVAIASRLTERVGIPHTVVHGTMEARWADELEKNVLTSFCADEHVWYLPVARYLLATSRWSYDGIAGDYLSASNGLRPDVVEGMRAGRVDELLDRVITETHHEDVLRNALTPAFYRRIPPSTARERLAEEIRRHLDAANPWSSFYFDTQDRREITLTPHTLLASLNVHTPYLDRDLVAFLTSVPCELHLGGRFHVDTIARAYPEHADLPYARDSSTPAGRRAAARAFRFPAHVVLHARSHLGRPRSALLRHVPPAVRHPRTGGTLGTFNPRAAWLRQLEIVASGPLGPDALRDARATASRAPAAR